MTKYVFYDNYDLSDKFDETKQYLIDEDEIEGYDDDKIWNLVYDNDYFEFDNLVSELKEYFYKNFSLFVGSVERWNGTYKGGKIGDFEDLFFDCIEDCNYVSITEDEDGILNITGSHHDGSVSFDIFRLTEEGYHLYDDWSFDSCEDESINKLTEEELHKLLVEKYLENGSFSREIYGYTCGGEN